VVTAVIVVVALPSVVDNITADIELVVTVADVVAVLFVPVLIATVEPEVVDVAF